MKNSNNLYIRQFPNKVEILTALPSEVNVFKNEDFKLFCLLFNNELNLKVNLKDEETSCQIECVYLAAEETHCRIHLDVNHAAPHTQSKQLIKGILTDSARVVFEGIIRMPPDSQHCIGMQNHRALVLSDKAQVQAVPELEIYADDVQCAHGSAVGPLDKNHLFYLMARGIDEATAKKMLAEAFVLDLIPAEYHEKAREWLKQYV